MTLVIDASMALAWVFERQQPGDAEQASRLLDCCGDVPWWVPGLWHLEVTRAHGLSSYDATYLELAQWLNATLASFDRQLNRAAAAIGVALFAGA